MELVSDFLHEHVTDEMVKAIVGWFSTACVALALVGKVCRWAFKDCTTNEQRQLFDALLRRLENGSLEWKINGPFLELKDFDCVLIQSHSSSGVTLLGTKDVTSKLTKTQKANLLKAANAKRAQIIADQEYEDITDSIREARRSV